MRKGVKFRLYPTAEQEAMINKTFGCCRYIYNRGLDLRIAAYKAGAKAGYKETAAMLTELKRKEETAFLGDFRNAHIRMRLHQLLCIADSVAVDHIREILSGKTLDDGADIGPVSRQPRGNIGNAKVRLFEKLLFLNDL